jgi:hypothetical protein
MGYTVLCTVTVDTADSDFGGVSLGASSKGSQESSPAN